MQLANRKSSYRHKPGAYVEPIFDSEPGDRGEADRQASDPRG